MYYNKTIDKFLNNTFEIRSIYRNVSFPEDITNEIMNEFGFKKVIPVSPPVTSFYEGVKELPPMLINDEWVQQWEVYYIHRSSEEILEYENDIKEAKLTEYKQAIQSRLDTFARTRGYDNIVSLCSYATSTLPQFAAEGQRGVILRDQCWSIGYTILAQAMAGEIPEPSIEYVLNQMPDMTW